MRNFKYLALAILSSSFIISCSPTPNLPNGNNTQNSSNNSLNSDAKVAFSMAYENEHIFKDTEVIASQKSEFNTKALLDGNINVDSNINIIPSNLTLDLNLKTDISSDLLATLGRSNFIIKSTNVASVNNNDGSTTKAIAVDFTGKTSGKTKSDTLVKTYYANGSQKLEHSLKVSFDNYNRVSTRSSSVSGKEKNIETKSTAKLSNGTIIDFNEKRIVSGDVEGSGTGTIDIKKTDGTTSKYIFNSTVDTSGKLMLTAKESTNNTEVMIVEKTNSTASATVKAQGSAQGSTSDLNTEFATETYATVNN